MRFRFFLSVVVLSAFVGVMANIGYTYLTSDRPNSEELKFKKFLDNDWEFSLKQNPIFASLIGDDRYADKISSNAAEEFENNKLYEISALDQIKSIDHKKLNKADQLNYRLIKLSYETSVEGRKYPSYLMRLNQRGGVQDYYDIGNRLNFSSKDDYENWFKRIESFSQNIKNSLQNNKIGLDLGYTQPKLVSLAVSEQISAILEKEIDEHPYLSIFYSAQDVMPENEANLLIQRVKNLIENEINPAYEDLNNFLINEYIPNSRNSIGISDVPNGREWYEYLARYHTTTKLTPDEIHEIGREEVARIRSEMEAVIESVGWKGDFQSFLEFLRTDPRFYYDTGDELLKAYRAMSKKIDAFMPTLFKKFPRAPYGVIPIPMESAPYTTTAYYNAPSDGRPGYYYANLYKPETRPKYEIPVLSVHEAVPGHHHQIALAQELENVPKFRKYLSFTSFVEGWGLYSEQLGESMGLYDDPYDKFGQLTYDMWRAIRLVVDTGMHYKGWSREEAENLFIENTAKTPLDISNEIDRYIAWPGQALAYKIGQLKIIELRDKAMSELGDKFDIRDFHDHILSFGSIPLNILEEKVEEFIEVRK